MARKQTPIIALIGAVVVGGFCLIGGAWKALVERGQGEYGIDHAPGDNWAYLWVGIAIIILAAAITLTVREVRKRRS